jgi:hypothetical protein
VMWPSPQVNQKKRLFSAELTFGLKANPQRIWPGWRLRMSGRKSSRQSGKEMRDSDASASSLSRPDRTAASPGCTVGLSLGLRQDLVESQIGRRIFVLAHRFRAEVAENAAVFASFSHDGPRDTAPFKDALPPNSTRMNPRHGRRCSVQVPPPRACIAMQATLSSSGLRFRVLGRSRKGDAVA